MSSAQDDKQRKNKRTLAMLLGGVVAAMFGFGYLLVPLYNVMCRVTGQNEIDAADKVVNTQVDRSRSITVEFDTNTRDLPWQFKAEHASMRVHPGEMAQAMFDVRNEKNYSVTGQAIPSYGPPFAAQYFKKIDCFCFRQQTLAPGEVRRMPVVFFVDPKLPRDVNTITLSYTFFEVEGASSKPTSAVNAGTGA